MNAHDIKRVVVIGSECTGKTTLARDLAEHFKTAWSPEYCRAYLEGRTAPLGFDDVAPIALGQRAGEDDALAAPAARAAGLVVHDTDLLSTIVYSRHYYADVPPEAVKLFASRAADLYLLCDIDLPWTPDGLLRDCPHNRPEMHALFENALRERGLPYRIVRGAGESRLALALMALAPLMSKKA